MGRLAAKGWSRLGHRLYGRRKSEVVVFVNVGTMAALNRQKQVVGGANVGEFFGCEMATVVVLDVELVGHVGWGWWRRRP